MAGISLRAFEPDKRKRWLVERGIEIISEASRHLGDDFKARRPEIPWRRSPELATCIRHDYQRVAHDVLWNARQQRPTRAREGLPGGTGAAAANGRRVLAKRITARMLGCAQDALQRREGMPTVGLVGVGLIGRAWANVFSRAGWDVRLWDPEAGALARRAGADRAVAAGCRPAWARQGPGGCGQAREGGRVAGRGRAGRRAGDRERAGARRGQDRAVRSASMRRRRRAPSWPRPPRPSSPRASPRS